MKNHAMTTDRDEKSYKSLLHKLEELYSQSEAVKMVNLQNFLDAQKNAEKDVSLKLSQMALKAMELQLRILSETSRHDDTSQHVMPREVWDTLLELPGVGPLLRRQKVQDELVRRLREKAQKE